MAQAQYTIADLIRDQGGTDEQISELSDDLARMPATPANGTTAALATSIEDTGPAEELHPDQDGIADTASGSAGTVVQPAPQDANAMAALVARVNTAQDMERVRVGCSLVNVFNYAIQVQAKRNNWNEGDYRAFIIALQAVDGIGAKAIDTKNTAQLEDAVKAALAGGASK